MTQIGNSVPASTHAGVSATAIHAPPAPPLLAEAWLLAWGRIGGAVTIGTDARIYPWFRPGIGCADDDCATVLMAELIDTPGLPAAVRIIVAASLHPKRRRAA